MNQLTLADGRILAWDEAGDPSGVPVLVFHGTPGSRLLPPMVDQQARDAGIRIVAPDRPGCGGSTFRPQRRLLDWPDDLEVLLDRTGIERFSVIGTSGGGPYALVTALQMSDRVDAVASLAGIGQLDTAAARASQPDTTRAMFELAAAGPTAATPITTEMLNTARDPARFAEWFMASLPPEDQADVGRHPELVPFFTAFCVEAGRQGAEAMAYEMWLTTQPWGFDVSDIAVPVKFFHGEMDMNVPLAHAEALSAAIEGSTLTVWPNEGHLVAFSRFADVLNEITK